MPVQLASDLTNTLRELREKNSAIWLGSEQEQQVKTPAELGARLVRVAEKNRSIRFVIALDEMESLVPLVASAPQQVRLFLGSLRRAAQATTNIAVLLTGVTTRCFDQSMLAEGVENPLFGFVEEFFLRPFTIEETSNLLRKLGRGMVLAWDEEALKLLQDTAGGFPFLVRDLASAVRRTAIGDGPVLLGVEPLTISRSIVEATLPMWTETACKLWVEIVRTLETHHPLHAEMIRAGSEAELSEWLQVGAEAQVAAKSLEALGLLARVAGSWVRSPTLISLQSLGTPESIDPEVVRSSQLQRAGDAERVKLLAASSEGPTLEFKESLRFNTITRSIDKKLELPTVKTVAAFLNCRGGTLLIGVHDDGTVLGIGGDLSLFSKSLDKFQLFVQTLLAKNLGAGITSRFVHVGLSDGRRISRLRDCCQARDRTGVVFA